jgi:hypothetical protein
MKYTWTSADGLEVKPQQVTYRYGKNSLMFS